jgi:CCR4-NOT transcription complex subunit 1
VLASIIERISQYPSPDWGERQSEDLGYAIKMRYQKLGKRMPQAVESALYLDDLLKSQDSRLAKAVQKAGPRCTSSLEASKEMLASVETRDISYVQVANALLFTVLAGDGDEYDARVLVQGLKEHRAGSMIDWTDVAQGFDKQELRITKKQFLGLYNALLPLAQEDSNLDIQVLWGKSWQFPATQLSFVVAFLSTTPEELDVSQIPNLRRVFTVQDYEDAPPNIKAFAAVAANHPLVSKDAVEVLFGMIFRSQESYNEAQMLGIPDTIINSNMPLFLCAAATVPRTAPLQEQALKQLFYPFVLKQHANYDFVMHSLWMQDKLWVASRLHEFYQSDNMLLVKVFEHAEEHGWLEQLLTVQNTFGVDLAAYAHGRGRCDLYDWSQPLLDQLGQAQYSSAIWDFLHAKLQKENQVQKEHVPPTTVPLELKTVHTLLSILSDLFEDLGVIIRQCLAAWPRLFNYGFSDEINRVLDRASAGGHALSEETQTEMEEKYKAMYGGEVNPRDVIGELKQLKMSEEPAKQDLFACMLHGLFEEYNCFGEYPNEALATTAVLFGGLIRFEVLSRVAEQAAISMVFEAVSVTSQDDPMYRFGLQALIHLLERLQEWPHLAERILQTPSLRGTQAMTAAEEVVRNREKEVAGMNGDGVNGITNGTLDEEYPVDSPTPPFSAIHIDPLLRPEIYEDPDENTSDKITFVLNNVSKRNLEEKFNELASTLEDKHHQWFAHYLVEELAKMQPNFQELYMRILQNFNQSILWSEVLRETYVSCARMLNSQATMDSTSERTNLKSLAGWLGSLTLARNQPILHKNISFKDLLIEGHDTQRLLVAIPFTCKTLCHAAKSRIFRPPNPWLMELLGLLSELYHCFELRLNLKFEIEVLCKDLQLDIKEVEPLDIIRGRPLLQENNMLQPYVPDAGAEGFGNTHLMSLSKRAPSERFSPATVMQALPDLGSMLQIPPSSGTLSRAQLENIFVAAVQQAIFEIIAPVVERSVTIAAISAAELIQKDFATEPDNEKVLNSAHTVVKSLSGSLALVTCKEPLRMSITNNIRIIAQRNLPEQLPEGQILMFVNDNIDRVCQLVEQAAEEQSIPEIDAQLATSIEDRRRHAEQRPNEPYNFQPVSRWATMIPEPFRQDLGGTVRGLNRQQLALYEEFGRQARIAPIAHGTNASQDARGQLPDVLSENYLPNLPTPAEAPVLPRPTPQQQRMQAIQPQGQPQANGYGEDAVGMRTLQLMQELQQAVREAPEEHINELTAGSTVRRVYSNLLAFIDSSMSKDQLVVAAGQQCFLYIYNDPQKRLEIEVFARLLTVLCRMSVQASRILIMYLAYSDDAKLFKADASAVFLSEGLLEVQHIDTQTAKALRAKNPSVLGFLRDLLDEVLLNEDSNVLRSDFALTYEALSQWTSEDPENPDLLQIITKLQIPVSQQNGMPSPPQHDGDHKQDQLEYIFEEWVRLQAKDTPERSYVAFVRQLHERHIVATPDEAIIFFRVAIEMCYNTFERITTNHFPPSPDAAYVHVDALSKLIAFMSLHQTAKDGEGQPDKAKSLDGILRTVVIIMLDQHNKLRERWNSRVYFRLLSSLLSDIRGARSKLNEKQEQEVYRVYANALLTLQPRYFPGFTFPWLALISHRMYIPALLGGSGRSNGGWETYLRLVQTLFASLGHLLQTGAETSQPIADFYRGVVRFLLLLHHDHTDFLIENHTLLNSSLPRGCPQLHNIINSAVTRAVMTEQPDPFAPGLKINRLDQVRQPPAVSPLSEQVLTDAGIKEVLERALSEGEPSNEDFTAISNALASADEATGKLIANALAVFLGVKATSVSSVFSAAASPARLLERLLRESSPPVRHELIKGMVNQVRYVNAHTHYFSTALQHMFTIGSEELQEQIMRVLMERLMAPRPHPWGLIVVILELMKNQSYDIWNLPWMKTAPQIQLMLESLAQNQDRLARGQVGGGMM